MYQPSVWESYELLDNTCMDVKKEKGRVGNVDRKII